MTPGSSSSSPSPSTTTMHNARGNRPENRAVNTSLTPSTASGIPRGLLYHSPPLTPDRAGAPISSSGSGAAAVAAAAGGSSSSSSSTQAAAAAMGGSSESGAGAGTEEEVARLQPFPPPPPAYLVRQHQQQQQQTMDNRLQQLSLYQHHLGQQQEHTHYHQRHHQERTQVPPPLRPLHFLCRQDGSFVPLIPADELPSSIQLREIPRMTTDLSFMSGMISLGMIPRMTDRCYTLVKDGDGGAAADDDDFQSAGEGENDVILEREEGSSSSPVDSPGVGGESQAETSRAMVLKSGNEQGNLGLDANANANAGGAGMKTYSSGMVLSTSSMIQENTQNGKQQAANVITIASTNSKNFNNDNNARVNNNNQNDKTKTNNQNQTQTQTDAMTFSNEKNDTEQQPPRKEKEYCTYWLFHGECAFIHSARGCKFKHEMPQDPQTMAEVGLKAFPKWWTDRYRSGSGSSRSANRSDWRSTNQSQRHLGPDHHLGMGRLSGQPPRTIIGGGRGGGMPTPSSTTAAVTLLGGASTATAGRRLGGRKFGSAREARKERGGGGMERQGITNRFDNLIDLDVDGL